MQRRREGQPEDSLTLLVVHRFPELHVGNLLPSDSGERPTHGHFLLEQSEKRGLVIANYTEGQDERAEMSVKQTGQKMLVKGGGTLPFPAGVAQRPQKHLGEGTTCVNRTKRGRRR